MAAYSCAKVLPPCLASIRPICPRNPGTSLPAITRCPDSSEYEATARMKAPQEKSPVVSAPSTRSWGGLSEWMSATCAAISCPRKLVTSWEKRSAETFWGTLCDSPSFCASNGNCASSTRHSRCFIFFQSLGLQEVRRGPFRPPRPQPSVELAIGRLSNHGWEYRLFAPLFRIPHYGI